MVLKKYSGFLSEKHLTIPELCKDDARWEMFLTKLHDKSPFTYSDGSKVVIENPEEIIESITDDNGEVDMDKVKTYLKEKNRYTLVIKTSKGNIKLNQLIKTEEFGAGPGTSLGSVNARTYETIQAIFFSLRQYLGRPIEPGDIHLLYTETNELQPDGDKNTTEDKSTILKDVHSTKVITRDDLKFFEDKGWVYTYIITANKLFESLDQRKHYTFYHSYAGHSIADQLYKSFKKAFHNINKDNNIRISMSRWNPSDIWVVETSYEKALINALKGIDDIIELNAVMDKCFEDNYLIGISLKKIFFGKDIELIISKNIHPNFRYEYTSVSENPFDTLTVQIHSVSISEFFLKRKETLDTRIYSGNEEDNIFLEVKGSASKYGKSSLNYINSILKRVKIEPIPLYNEIDLTDEQLRRRIKKLYSTIPNLKLKPSRSQTRWNIKHTRSKLISKYQSLLLVDKLERYKKKPYKKGVFRRLRFLFNNNLNLSNYIIKDIFYYAYSMGGELFDTCKFYRIRTKR